MAGTVTKEQAEGFWNKYNKDGNNELTADEVKECLQEVYDTVDEEDIKGKFAFFGQCEVKSVKKEDFIKGMVRADKCCALRKAFEEIDTNKSGTLTMDELEAGLDKVGIDGEQAKIIMEELEYDGDGEYDVDEFVEVVGFSEMFLKEYDI
ncbi:calcium-dependent protein kinase [Mactra antiquata]